MDFYTFDDGIFDGLETTSVQYLTFAVALEAFLSDALGVSVWPLHVPQFATSYPQLTYRLLKRRSDMTTSGASKSVWVDYRLDAIATTKLDALNLAETLRGLLQGFRGGFGGLQVNGCRKIDRAQGFAATTWNSSQGTYTVPSTYQFNYIRST